MQTEPRNVRVFFTFLVGVVTNAFAADELPASLTAKGLEKEGNQVVIIEEAALAQQLKDTKAIQVRFLDAHRDAYRMDAQLLAVYNEYASLKMEQTKLEIDVQSEPDRYKKHGMKISIQKISARAGTIASNLGKDRATVDAAFKSLSELRKSYVEAIRSLDEAAKRGTKRYEEIAADPSIKPAIDELNQSAPKPMTLGPSRNFTANAKSAEKYCDFLRTGTIAIRHKGNENHVDVIFNGKPAIDFCLAPEYSATFMAESTAADIGVVPIGILPTSTFVTKDQATYQGKWVPINSAKIGDFEVFNSVAVVFDQNSPSKQNRLGQAFLRNYWFEIDAKNQKLTLIEVNDVAIKKQTAAGKKQR